MDSVLRQRRRIPAVLWDAAADARACREAARAEAAEIVERAHREAEILRAEGAARGREEGLAAVAETMAAAVLQRDRLLCRAQRELVDLAFDIAASVIGAAAERHRDVVLEVTGRALDAARGRTEISVRANPLDLDALRAADPELVERLARPRRIRWIADAAIPRGGVVVETELGRVDARLESTLAALRRSVEAAADAADSHGDGA